MARIKAPSPEMEEAAAIGVGEGLEGPDEVGTLGLVGMPTWGELGDSGPVGELGPEAGEDGETTGPGASVSPSYRIVQISGMFSEQL